LRQIVAKTGRPDHIPQVKQTFIYLSMITGLTPIFGGQFLPARDSEDYRLLQLSVKSNKQKGPGC